MLRVASIFCSLSPFPKCGIFSSLSMVSLTHSFPLSFSLFYPTCPLPFLPLYLSQYPLHTFFFFLFSYSFLPTTYYLTMFLSFCLPLPPSSFLSLPLSLSLVLTFFLSLTHSICERVQCALLKYGSWKADGDVHKYIKNREQKNTEGREVK